MSFSWKNYNKTRQQEQEGVWADIQLISDLLRASDIVLGNWPKINFSLISHDTHCLKNTIIGWIWIITLTTVCGLLSCFQASDR